MTTFLNALRSNDTVTENGMPTNSTSLNSLVDLFFVIGAVRPQMNDEDGRDRLIQKFEAAHSEDAHLTRKLMFWARDVRGGAGEREAFRVLLRYSCENYPNEVIPNLHLISEFGRWDDIFVAIGTPVEDRAIELIASELKRGNSLLAKWMPRTSGKTNPKKKYIANRVSSKMGLNPKSYRKLLVEQTKVVETAMCQKDYSKVNYSHVPSLAMSRYTKAFDRNDNERFSSYLEALSKGEAKVNTGAIYPYNVIKTLEKGSKDLAIEQWSALPNYLKDSKERILPVCDVSGSMDINVSGSTTALDVCISLGLYISERNEGPFKDAFITFSTKPSLQYLKGNLFSRYEQLKTADWKMSTNLEATFELILNKAIENEIPSEEMPTSILIMSDMEFDSATKSHQVERFFHRGSSQSSPNSMKMIRKMYQDSGYTMPKIIFWNLQSRRDNYPVRVGENGTALISGFSPSILKSVLSCKEITPESVMLETINSSRYSEIK